MKMTLSKGASLSIARLRHAGFEAYAVGGCVRDTLMGKKPSDFDVTTSALPQETKSLFTDFTTFDAGIAHGTVAVVIEGETVEITTFRSDGEYLDHRHPIGVSFTSKLDEDLSRRDFTVNAMAYNQDEGFIDLYGGMKDIQDKVIRCVGVAECRFEEDALRILRALRFSSVLDFDIEKETAEAIHRKAQLLHHVSRERVYVEIKKLLSGVRAQKVIEEYSDVFKVLFGDISPKADALSDCSSDILRLCAFFYNKLEAFATLKPSKRENALLKSIIVLAKDNLPDSEIELKRLIASYTAETVRLSLELRLVTGERVGDIIDLLDKIVQSGKCIKREQLAISGSDIIALGVKPSQQVGEILDTLFEEVLTKKIDNDRYALLKKVEEKLNK